MKGPLSLFVNLSGESHATAGKHRARVDSSTYFLSNNEQYYTLEVDADAPVELFNIHFGQEFAPQVAAAFTKGTSAALESPETNGQATHFYNQLYPRTAEFNQLVKGLANHPNINSNALLREEYLGNIMALLLKEHQQLQQHIEQLPAVRVAVREEVYQRLARAVDYMHSHYEADLSLDELAAVVFGTRVGQVLHHHIAIAFELQKLAAVFVVGNGLVRVEHQMARLGIFSL